ncbi:MAG TPA: NAD-dependent epimerase/dehydratase family protein [Vicinamibacteria bacterium]|nr:NAD-dependent epimerase/dehydratase family protein [Vicinamibacteria bacterium]
MTGATGFVGGHLVEALAARGDEVSCLVRPSAADGALRALGGRCVRGTLEDDAALRDLVDGAEVVFHVAGAIAAPSLDAFLAVNARGTSSLAGWARAAAVRRLVYVSSLAVTGPTVPGRPLDEGGRPSPVTPYGRSKWEGEEAVRASGVPFTIVRPPIVYGPRDREVLRLFRMARRGLAPVFGGGAQELSLVHARDLAGALLAAAVSPRAEGGTYHAAHPAAVTQRGLMEAIGLAVGRRVRLVAVPPRAVRGVLAIASLAARLRGRSTLLDPAKAGELLAPAWTCSSAALARDAGWHAAVDLREGLAQTARWYREAGWL